MQTEKDNETPTRDPKKIDKNLYATKKSVSQGLLDVALLTSNVAQLKNAVLDPNVSHVALHRTHIILLVVSILLQVTERKQLAALVNYLVLLRSLSVCCS